MAMETIARKEFEADIVRERSITPVLEQLGTAKCSMELFGNNCGVEPNAELGIEWIVEFADDSETVEQIGIWLDEKKRLRDYDGVFSLPKEAVQLLRSAGIIVPREFTE